MKRLILLLIMLYACPSFAQDGGKQLIYERDHATIPSSEYSSFFRENSNGQVRREFIYEGKDGAVPRTYQVYIPENYSAKKEYPVIVLLHGPKRTGVSLVQKWMPLADSAELVLIGPTHPSKGWDVSLEEANIIEGMIDHLDEKVNIDRSRLYLFGHSAGGHFASYMTVLKPNLFAAIAVHAGYFLNHKIYFQVDNNFIRKTPIIFIAGMSDAIVPSQNVSASAKFLAEQGHDAMYVEYIGHTHWYYTIANEINLKALTFLSQFKKEEN